MNKNTKELQGATAEHWMDKALRQRKPINLPDNIIRIGADALLKMNTYRNQLLGTDISLHELAQMSDEEK